MRIEKLKIRNYKSFDEPIECSFGSGFNVIAGQNSTGKTAMLELLSLAFAANPHRSLKALPTREAIPDPVSWAEVELCLQHDELLAVLSSSDSNRTYHMALPSYPSAFASSIGYGDNSAFYIKRLVEHVLSLPVQVFKACMTPGSQTGYWHLPSVPSNGLYEPQAQVPYPIAFGQFRIDWKRNIHTLPGVVVSAADGEYGLAVLGAAASRIFRFTAERLNIGECRFGTSTSLQPNASNLAEVLNSLQQNPHLFSEFNRLLHIVLPQVQQITVRPLLNDMVQITVWPHDPKSAREDIAIPLNQCGTGIGQVLAILYVAVYSQFPRIILIDEPQSFLHPGAVRKLIEVLGNYRQHQFIISTHSPGVISAADPDNIIVTQLESGVSKLSQVSARDNRDLQLFLAEIGAHFSDLFGADTILWVEGRTEEACFPLILRGVADQPLAGVAIVGVSRTGDLEEKDAAHIFEIYDSLSTSGTLVPSAVGFVLDSECRSLQKLQEIRKRSNGLAMFLPRRMYENYLLNPAAIAAVMSGIEGFQKESATANAISAATEVKRTERKYYCDAESAERADWVTRVDGGRMLRDLFSEFSNKTVEYDKVAHGIQLTRWLIQNSPSDLKEVADLLGKVVKQTD